jgi:KDO2-lipid IV(A) lauroyltransferase
MKHKIEYLIVCLLVGFLRVIPLKLGVWMGRLLGDIYYLVDRKHRKGTIEHLQLAYGESKPLSELKQIACDSFRGQGMSVVEAICLQWMNLSKVREWVSVDGLSHYIKAQQEGKGVILLTAHLGNWEIVPKAFLAHGFKICGTVRPLDNPYLNQLSQDWREQNGMMVLNKFSDSTRILKLLRAGETIGFLLDQNTHREDAVFVDFFGQEAATNKGVAILALRSGAPVLPVFMKREGARHRMVIDEAFHVLRTGSSQDDILKATALFTKIIEKHIRKAPEQWLWVHRRWKTKRTQKSHV